MADQDEDERSEAPARPLPAGNDSELESDRGSGTSSDKGDRAGKTGNAWKSVGDRMGETLREGIKGPESDHELELDEDEEEEPPDDEDELEDEEESDREGEDSESKGETGKEGAEEEDEEDKELRYEVVDEAGDRFAIDLPDGAKIRFTGDGKQIELDSMDDLIGLAQKGAAFDRVSSTAGQTISQQKATISAYEAAQKDDSDLLLKLVFGELSDEELEKLQKELEPYKDPKARAGLEALADKEQRTAAEKLETERQQREAAGKFWDAADAQIKADLSRFSYLDAEDAKEIKDRFYGVYQSERARLIPEYEKVAAEKGLTKADAEAAADHDARLLLTEKTLRAVMRDLNAKFQKRAGKGGDGKAERKGISEAERHNRHDDDKRAQRRDPARRSLRGGGSAPRDRIPGSNGQPAKTWEQKLERGFARLRRAGREAAGSGDEEE